MQLPILALNGLPESYFNACVPVMTCVRPRGASLGCLQACAVTMRSIRRTQSPSEPGSGTARQPQADRMALGNYVTVTNRDRMATVWRARVSDQSRDTGHPFLADPSPPVCAEPPRPALRTCDTSRELSG